MAGFPWRWQATAYRDIERRQNALALFLTVYRLCHGLSVGLHVCDVLCICPGKTVMPLIITYKIEIVGLGWMKRRLQGRLAGIGDGPRRHPGTPVGVVRRIKVQIGLVYYAAVAAVQQRCIDH